MCVWQSAANIFLFALVDLQVEDVTIVMDRNTGRSKGYGFVTFQTMEGAFNSLQEPEKEFDVRGTTRSLIHVCMCEIDERFPLLLFVSTGNRDADCSAT
jgi:hypothetical protein